MCTLVIARNPDSDWPLLVAANRDEMIDRPWLPPGRHWPDRADIVAGQDTLAGGSWLGINDTGVVAAILNRTGSLGPAADKRSRGELVLEALDHVDARDAVVALARLDGTAYRSFNLIVADNRDTYWLRATGEAKVTAKAIPSGVHMFTSRDMDDTASPRIRNFLERFRSAPPPDPAAGDWSAWQALLANRMHAVADGPAEAMCVVTDRGYGTVSSSLIALPSIERAAARPVWLFTAGRPGEATFEPVPV
jgi:uncharacterized protein with NRDE domain